MQEPTVIVPAYLGSEKGIHVHHVFALGFAGQSSTEKQYFRQIFSMLLH